MPTIPLKFVVSFSSQDDNHPIQNIITGDGFKKWLSHPKGKCSSIEAIFQLEGECTISYIDVGSHYCANIEILVGRSEWPQDRDYQTLILTTQLMSVTDSRMGNNVTKTRMFNSDNFVKDVAALKWDRVKVICRQPFRRDVQYGLSFLRIKSAQTHDITPTDKLEARISIPNITPPKNSVTNMKKQVFKNIESSGSPSIALKTKLLKIAESSELGSSHTESLTRTAKIVLAAADTAGPFSPSTKVNREEHKFFSQHLEEKNAPKFTDEVCSFVKKLGLTENDLESVKIVDLRHKFERQKKRKLTQDEKRVFIQQIKSSLRDIFSGSGSDSSRAKSQTNTRTEDSQNKPIMSKASKEFCDNNLLTRTVMNCNSDEKHNSSLDNEKSSSILYNPQKCEKPRRTLISSTNQPVSQTSSSDTLFSSPPLISNTKGSSRKRKRHDDEASVFCTKCQETIPEHTFSQHYIMCSPYQNGNYSGGGSVSRDAVDLTESASSFSDTQTEDFVPCPICGNEFDVKFIEVHANMCIMQLEG